MFEILGVLLIIFLVYYIIKDGGPRTTIWSYLEPGEIKWPKWKRKKKK